MMNIPMSNNPLVRWIGSASFGLGFVLGLSVNPSTNWPQTSPTRSEMHWYWTRGCRKARTIGLVLLLDGKPIYRSPFIMCLFPSQEGPSEQEIGAITFSIKGGHTFQGNLRTGPEQTITCDLWQAGTEPNGLFLGVSFSTKDRVLLNTLHFASPDSARESKLDRGLLIRTYPLPSSTR